MPSYGMRFCNSVTLCYVLYIMVAEPIRVHYSVHSALFQYALYCPPLPSMLCKALNIQHGIIGGLVVLYHTIHFTYRIGMLELRMSQSRLSIIIEDDVMCVAV